MMLIMHGANIKVAILVPEGKRFISLLSPSLSAALESHIYSCNPHFMLFNHADMFKCVEHEFCFHLITGWNSLCAS
jgi:hypothetical protein